jgi:transcriptional regulator with XRE-family HTH domain
MTESQHSDFDVPKLWEALDAKRESSGLSEKQMMDEINTTINAWVPMSLATVKNMVRRNVTTCQHALHLLRWLDKTPESFLIRTKVDESLPFSAEGRLYWSMRALADAVSDEKEQQSLTWNQVAQELNCTPNQVSGLRKIRYGISIHLAMRITQWLHRPSTDFIVVM